MRRSKPRPEIMENETHTTEQRPELRYSKNYKPQYGASRVTGTRAGGFMWNVPYECTRRVFNFDGFRWTEYCWCKECQNKECPCKEAVAEQASRRGYNVIPDVPADKLTDGERRILARMQEDPEFAKGIIIVNPDRIGALTQPRRRS